VDRFLLAEASSPSECGFSLSCCQLFSALEALSFLSFFLSSGYQVDMIFSLSILSLLFATFFPSFRDSSDPVVTVLFSPFFFEQHVQSFTCPTST